MTPGRIIALGLTAGIGGCLAAAADYFSAYTGSLEMATAMAVGFDQTSILLAAKPIIELQIGNFLGLYFIPFHMIGFYLLYRAMRPTVPALAMLLLGLGIYTVTEGAAFHGALLYAGAVVQSGNPAMIDAIAGFYSFQAITMVVLLSIYSIAIAALVISGRTVLPRWSILILPPGVMVGLMIVTALLPDSWRDVREFLVITGFNLPSAIGNVALALLLAKQPEVLADDPPSPSQHNRTP